MIKHTELRCGNKVHISGKEYPNERLVATVGEIHSFGSTLASDSGGGEGEGEEEIERNQDLKVDQDYEQDDEESEAENGRIKISSQS